MKETALMIEDISGDAPLYKNSTSYESSDWRPFSDLTCMQPVQRKITSKECVMDLDDVSDYDMSTIPAWLKATGLKFIAWKSGPKGMHIHFWTDIVGKEQKKELTRFMSAKLEEKFGVKNDLLPMGHGHIRAEFSIHPEKGYQKEFLSSNISVFDPINIIPDAIREQIKSCDVKVIKGNTGEVKGKIPKCMRYILSHQFSDGRERMIFILASWCKANGLSTEESMEKIMEWARRQGYSISPHKIRASINSSTGKVGCRYRHDLLEEIGVDIGECKYE